MASNQESRLQQAIDGYRSGRYSSIRAAAAANDIPRTTLRDRLNGCNPRSLAQEPQKLLRDKQEELLKRWIIDLDAQGHPATFAIVRELAIVLSKVSGGPQKIGQNWMTRFFNRHPEIRSKIVKKIQAKPIKSTIPEVLES